MQSEQVGKLGVAHQVIFVVLRQNVGLALLLPDQMCLEHLLVQLQHWVGEHTHSQVDKAQFHAGEPFAHAPEQLPCQAHIVLTVLAILLKLRLREVLTAQSLGVIDLSALLANAIELSQNLQAPAYVRTVKRSAHRQGIQPTLGFDLKMLGQNEPVEHGVVG